MKLNKIILINLLNIYIQMRAKITQHVIDASLLANHQRNRESFLKFMVSSVKSNNLLTVSR